MSNGQLRNGLESCRCFGRPFQFRPGSRAGQKVGFFPIPKRNQRLFFFPTAGVSPDSGSGSRTRGGILPSSQGGRKPFRVLGIVATSGAPPGHLAKKFPEGPGFTGTFPRVPSIKGPNGCSGLWVWTRKTGVSTGFGSPVQGIPKGSRAFPGFPRPKPGGFPPGNPPVLALLLFPQGWLSCFQFPPGFWELFSFKREAQGKFKGPGFSQGVSYSGGISHFLGPHGGAENTLN